MDDGLVRQGEESGADGVQQQSTITARQIGAADGTAEEDIPGEKMAVAVKRNPAGRVAGGCKDLQLEAADSDFLPALQPGGDLKGFGRGEAKEGALQGQPGEDALLPLMEQHLRPARLLQQRDRANMVEMGVGQQDAGKTQPPRRQLRQEFLPVVAGIDEGGLFSLRRAHQVAVFLEGAGDKGLDDHDCRPPSAPG